jgi:hypothetical protein
MIVMIGISPLRRACRMITTRLGNPFERAVVTYSLCSTSSMLARV